MELFSFRSSADIWGYPPGLGPAITQRLRACGMEIIAEHYHWFILAVPGGGVRGCDAGYWIVSDNGGELQVDKLNWEPREGVAISATVGPLLGSDVQAYAATVVHRILNRLAGLPIDYAWRPQPLPWAATAKLCRRCGGDMALDAAKCLHCGHLVYMPVTRQKGARK